MNIIASQIRQRLLERVRTNIFRSKFVRYVSVLTVANGISAILSFVQGILVARWLGPELYGVTALVMSFPSLIYTFFEARSSEASVKYLSEFHVRGEKERALAMVKVGYVVDFGVALLAFLIILPTASWAARSIVHQPEMDWLIIVYASAFLPRALVGTSYAVMATLGRFSVIATIETLATVLRVFLVIGLVVAGWQVAGVVWGNALSMTVRGLLYGMPAYSMVRDTWGSSWLRSNWQELKGRRREIFGFLAYNDLNALIGMIPKQLDVVFLGYFRNPIETGYYKLAKNISATVGYLVGPLQSVTYPDLARLWGIGDKSTLKQKIRKLSLWVGLPFGFAILGVALLIPFILPPLVGQDYSPAIAASQILLIGSAIWLAFFWLRPTFMAQGKVKIWTGISLIVSCFSILGFLVIIPTWGYLGLAFWLMVMIILGHSIAALYLLLKHEVKKW